MTVTAERYIVFWDIDGTLLFDGGLGQKSLFEAAERFGGDLSKAGPSSGKTDFQIMHELFDSRAGAPEGVIGGAMRAYETLFCESWPSFQGARLLANVLETLMALDKCEKVTQSLITGNTRVVAKAKLEHFGVWRFFRGGGFGDSQVSRLDVAKSAVHSIRGLVQLGERTRLIVIGDTVLDVQCARRIGAIPVAVASGATKLEALRAECPAILLGDLSVSTILSLVGG